MKILIDRDIKKLVRRGELFTRTTFSATNCRGCFYDLRLARGQGYSINQAAFFAISDVAPLQIAPGECVWVLTVEDLNFRSGRYCGLIFAVVALLHVGVSHIATTVDPGFYKQLIISITNHSNRPITLRPGASIAKLLIIDLETKPDSVWVPDVWWQTFPEELRPPILEEPWHPVTTAEVADLDDVVHRYGPPNDVLASLLRKSVTNADLALASSARVDDVNRLLNSFEARLARLEGQFERRETNTNWQRNLVLTLIVLILTLGCTVLTAFLGAWATGILS